jgi:peptidoglycan/xylan/chitin deacetylase (PgdA/CDA1 family)
MTRYALIRLALEALSASRIRRSLPATPDAAGMIVTLHHVRPRQLSPFDPNGLLAITPEFLDRFIAHFLANGWRFVSVTELIGAGPVCDPRRIAVTLDDGYRNNSEYALPVFRRHQVPFTIYACPGFCDRSAEIWWEALERIIGGTDSVSLAGEGPAEQLPTRSTAEKNRAFRLWTDWLTRRADEVRQRRVIRALSQKYGLDLPALARELVMDWDEMRAIAADPLCSIGAHTMTHPALARLSPQAAYREMADSADRIETEIGERPTTIAFPYGYPAAAGHREASLAERAGFAGSFTTQPGYLRRNGARHGVPRVSINGLYQDLKYMDVLLTPGFWELRDRIRRPLRRPAGPASASR